MQKSHSFIFGALFLGTMVACQKEDVGLSNDAILQSNKDDILSYTNSKGLSGTMTSTGLYYVLAKPGHSSVAPAYGQEIEFSYTLYALTRSSGNSTAVTDKKVDSTYSTSSVFYPFYQGSLKEGLEEGLLKMHEGDQSILLLPSTLAFGNVATGIIPANSPVRFDVTLKRVRTEDQQINEYLTANKLTPTEVTTSGLRFIKTLANPTGASPTATQSLIVKYRGKLLRSASAFDSTGTGTYLTTIGKSIAGFDEGLAKLKVGEKATLVFPSKLGYSTAGNRSIPPYAPLRFDIELVSVQ